MGPGALQKSPTPTLPLRRVGVIVAMAWEAHCLGHRESPVGSASLGADADLHVSGIGKDRARRAAEALVEAGATGLLSCGVAGGLDPDLTPGAVVLADTVIDASGTPWPTDHEWRETFAQRAAPARQGAVFCSDAPVADSTEKAGLYARYRACAVDMESAAIARVAAHHGLPFAVLRVIVDPAWLSIPPSVLHTLDGGGEVRTARLVRGLLRHPSETAPLVRLAFCRRRAGAALGMLARQLDERWGPQ